MDDIRNALLALARLQDEESALAATVGQLAKLPERLAAVEKSLGGAEAALARARADVQEAQKERRAFEADIEAIKATISRYQGQLNEVKTNEQYRALNQEIAHERRKIDAAEERILLNMERTDGLNRTIQDKQAFLAGEKQRVAREKAVLEAERARLEAERSERERTIASLEASIPADLVGRYRRVASTRGGIGLARARDGACGECRVRARPQALAEARAFERVVQCDSCNRILLVLEAPPASAAPAGAAGEAAGAE